MLCLRCQYTEHAFTVPCAWLGRILNGTHQLVAYADDVNILGGSIHTLKENAEVLVAATREIGLKVSADKTKYIIMFQDQNAG